MVIVAPSIMSPASTSAMATSLSVISTAAPPSVKVAV